MSLPDFPRRTAVLGATGFIGEKALAVARRHPDRFRVTALAAGRSADALAELAGTVRPRRVALADPSPLEELRRALPDGVEAGGGAEAVAALAADPDTDLVVNGIMGRAGLEASLAAAESGKLLALANKESMVLAGPLLMGAARRGGATVVPVDSEHSGLFQCLAGLERDQVRRVIITASGGPFRGRKASELAQVSPEEALNHPVWPMGARITVDSATLLNKGLEVIETYHLFDIPLDRIEVWVHPQSVVHALVETVDGSLIAQLSAPDMLLPVQYAMSYPERWDSEAPPCRLPDWGSLTFEAPDHDTFPAIRLAVRAAERGGTAPAVMNAADEVVVAAFLAGRIPFTEIIPRVEAVLEAVEAGPADSLAAVAEADRAARAAASRDLGSRAG